MTEQRDRIILVHMFEDVSDILSFVDGKSSEQFAVDRMLKKAVGMSLLNIGELARELSETVKKRHPAIPWKSIVGLRNRAAHGYHSLVTRVLWEISTIDMLPFRQAIESELSTDIKQD